MWIWPAGRSIDESERQWREKQISHFRLMALSCWTPCTLYVCQVTGIFIIIACIVNREYRFIHLFIYLSMMVCAIGRCAFLYCFSSIYFVSFSKRNYVYYWHVLCCRCVDGSVLSIIYKFTIYYIRVVQFFYHCCHRHRHWMYLSVLFTSIHDIEMAMSIVSVCFLAQRFFSVFHYFSISIVINGLSLIFRSWDCFFHPPPPLKWAGHWWRKTKAKAIICPK